ncbi:hypothetical protein LCGC14_0315910 [marine sediment metagenome]|uniref:Uncharacterized protein n=1 Tax=marine sediment metagenome TaxID=412755 RepID=A0A0F9TQQ0_9ZZZZ
MKDEELEKLIHTWEKIMGELGPTRNMIVIIQSTLVKLYELRLRKSND